MILIKQINIFCAPPQKTFALQLCEVQLTNHCHIWVIRFDRISRNWENTRVFVCVLYPKPPILLYRWRKCKNYSNFLRYLGWSTISRQSRSSRYGQYDQKVSDHLDHQDLDPNGLWLTPTDPDEQDRPKLTLTDLDIPTQNQTNTTEPSKPRLTPTFPKWTDRPRQQARKLTDPDNQNGNWQTPTTKTKTDRPLQTPTDHKGPGRTPTDPTDL